VHPVSKGDGSKSSMRAIDRRAIDRRVIEKRAIHKRDRSTRLRAFSSGMLATGMRVIAGDLPDLNRERGTSRGGHRESTEIVRRMPSRPLSPKKTENRAE